MPSQPTPDRPGSTDSRAPATLDYKHLTRGHTRALPYGFLSRLMDRRHGLVDGIWDRRTDRSAWADDDTSQVSPDRPEAITMQLSNLASTYAERVDDELLRIRAVEAPQQARTEALRRYIADTRIELEAAETARAQVPDEPDEATLASRGVAEEGDPEQLTRARRRTEHHQRLVQPADDRVRTARHRIQVDSKELADLEAVVLVARDIGVARVQRLRDHYERRSSVYRRAWMHAWQRGSYNSSTERIAPRAIREREVLSLPEWALAHLAHRTNSPLPT